MSDALNHGIALGYYRGTVQKLREREKNEIKIKKGYKREGKKKRK